MLNVDAVTLLGLFAATCTTVAFIPQVLKNWRTKTVGDLSFGTFGLLTLGILVWLIYGLLLENVPIIAANAITLVLNLVNLAQMVGYRRREARASRSAG